MPSDNEQMTSSIETMLDNYILDHDLGDGAPLPSVDELAAVLQCDAKRVQEALATAEQKHRVTCAEGRWRTVPVPTVHDTFFSFTKSNQGRSLTTKVMEATTRPPTVNRDNLLYATERRAHAALGLTPPAPFIFIERVRLFAGHPAALQRVYLNPNNFPGDFLARHNFENESLIDTYKLYGYTLTSRDTVLSALLTPPGDRYDLQQIDRHFSSAVALDAEQRLYAVAPGRPLFVLEYLRSFYFGDWRYEIKNRPASA